MDQIATPWPASAVKMRAIDTLVPYARNARTHSDAQVQQLAASINEFGWTVPVLLDEGGGIIAGHGRVLAGKLLGIERVPCMTAKGWSDEKKRLYVLADNKLALNAGWDNELLGIELADLAGLGADVALAGFTEVELADLLPASGLLDPMDGGNTTSGDNGDVLVWGKVRVPITPEEVAMLDEALARHARDSGVRFGFVRETFKRGDVRS